MSVKSLLSVSKLFISFCIICVLFCLSSFFWLHLTKKKNHEVNFLYERFEENITKCQNNLKINDLCMKELFPIANDIKKKFSNTSYASMSSFKLATVLYKNHYINEAKQELEWIIDHTRDMPFSYLAKLHLANIFLDEGAFDLALNQLSCPNTSGFYSLFLDKKGDIYFASGKNFDARTSYMNALKDMDRMDPYRYVIEFKLDALGGPLFFNDRSKNHLG